MVESRLREFEIPAEKGKWQCRPERFGFKTTDDLEPIRGIIGQKRAVRALKLGMEIQSPGYNIFVSGIKGTGRLTTVRNLLKDIQPRCERLNDYCYVHNFRNPMCPVLVTLEKGGGVNFKRDMKHILHIFTAKIPAALEEDEFLSSRRELIESHQTRQHDFVEAFKSELEQNGLVMAHVRVEDTVQSDILVKTDENPVPINELDSLVETGKIDKKTSDALRDKVSNYRECLEHVMRESRKLAREMMEKVNRLERKTGGEAISGYIRDLDEKYKNLKISHFLRELKDDVLNNLSLFASDEESSPGAPGPVMVKDREFFFRKFEVNVVQDNSESDECPIVIEHSPTYTNLFGAIGAERDFSGNYYSDHTTIRSGSLLRANGGYLVINTLDTLSESGVWKALKRSLRTKEIVVQSYDTYMQMSPVAIQVEPIPLNIKVIMIGDSESFHRLYSMDEDFQKVFKVKADFGDDIKLTEENLNFYTRFLRKLSIEEGLLPFNPSGVARVVEFGVRHAGRRTRISTQFSEVADLVRESSFWALKEGFRVVDSSHVVQAMKEIQSRNSLPEERHFKLIDDGIILIDATGKRVGQVNGLTVYDLGNYAFGVTARITASVSVGKSGIINIEREAKLSGRIHDKGVLILSGYLRENFAREHPLALSASICFEQSYTGVEGDSASSTEIYVLLSALSGLPLRQDLAVTGSVNQKGDIQPIGGVNEKIEGFYRLCRNRGLTGNQGVLIPKQNVEDLMLHDTVIEAMRKGRFHVFAVERVEDGIELLTGVPAGERDEEGRFEEGTVFARVEERLSHLQKCLKRDEENDLKL